ncbi:hypothetical protein FNYG_02331 [Fusarium nygamai]|uniref:Uncharacterized protein n=1 Tax=Gibberella nygamai TaxID=42673 RepID=A0A2K0WPU7_GIBNY|nr:hypothetical protein FNYG_02331 [Fusarium nygamai]
MAAALRFGRLTSKTNHAFEALLDSGTVTVTQLVEAEAPPSPGTESQVITHEEQDDLAQPKEGTQDTDATDARADKSDANDEGTHDKREDQQGDDRSTLSKSLIVVRREKPQAREYDFVWRDGDIFSIGTDTDMYKAAFQAQTGDCQTIPMFTLDYLLENLADAQQGQDAPTEDDLQDFLALEMPSLDESDTEPATESFSIQIDRQRPTYAFLGNGLDNISDTATSLPFCVWVFCDLQACQIFALQEPCDGACKHVRLEVMDISMLQRVRPYTMTFRCMSYSMLLNEEAAVGTQAELQLECFSMCQKKNGCRHTLVEDAASPEACCVRPVTLRAWLGHDVVEGEAVALMEDGASYDDCISADFRLEDDDDVNDDDDNNRNDDDDYDDDVVDRALNLGLAVMNGSNIPALIDFDLLINYLKVVDKYELGELYLSQGLHWAIALLPTISTSFDEDAVAWLWILWRLNMPTEFKKLSAIIAQQATRHISPEPDRHGVEMPVSIIRMYSTVDSGSQSLR